MVINVVFHVDEVEKWDLALANAHNLLAGIERERSKVEILINGEAVKIFASAEERTLRKMKILSEGGVAFRICQNSLRAHGIDETALPGFISPVPIGVLELAEKQLAGYAYIRP